MVISNELISLKEASKISGYHSDYLSFLIRSGKLKGVRVGRAWLVDQNELEAFIKVKEGPKSDLVTNLDSHVAPLLAKTSETSNFNECHSLAEGNPSSFDTNVNLDSCLRKNDSTKRKTFKNIFIALFTLGLVVGILSLSFTVKAFPQVFSKVFGNFATAFLAGGSPQTNYQGKLTEITGIAVPNNTYNLRFKLYATSTGGSPLWTETYCYSPDSGTTCNGTGVNNKVQVTSGLFSTMLGSITSLSGIDFNQVLYLGVEVGSTSSVPVWDGEMTPRKRVGVVPSAFVANNLNGVTDTQFVRLDTANSTSSTGAVLTLTQNGLGNIVDFYSTTTKVFYITSIGDGYFTGNISAQNFSGTSTGSNTGDVTLAGSSTANGLALSGQALTLSLSGSSATGTLSSTDWTTFNNKVSLAYASSTYIPLLTASDTQAFTGFIDGNNTNVAYNHTNRTVTLTGNLDYYWNGVKKTLASPWTSSAHTATVGSWFLYSSDGTNFVWSQTPWNFSAVMVAYVNYQASVLNSFAIRETHGTMDLQSHIETHSQIGTYRVSGGGATAGSYTENTATDAGNTMGFDQSLVKDEDSSTVVPATTDGLYTTMYIGPSNTDVFNTTATLPFTSAGTFIQVNNPVTGTLTAGANARYYNVYQILVPAASDSDSQKYRVIMLQPQTTFTSLASAQAEDVRGLNLGNLSNLATEFVIYTRITYVTANPDNNTGKCRIATGGISYVSGNKAGQVSVTGFTTNNHATLSNLTWLSSGHIGSINTIPAFDASGLATEIPTASLLSTSTASSTYLSIANATSTYVPYTGATTAVDLNTKTLVNVSNVGIGTTTPVAKLEVYGTAGNNAIANFASSTNASVLYIAANGNIGVGTNSPSTKLHVNSPSGNAVLRLQTSDVSANITNGYDYLSSTIGTANITLLRASGNFGVGTTTPEAKLSVYGTAGNNAIANFASSSNSSVLYIGANGNVGVGTTAPGAKLSVKSSGVGTSFEIQASDSTNQPVSVGESAVGTGFLTLWKNNVGAAIKFDANANSYINTGNVGIGTTSPNSKLTVYGASGVGAFELASNANSGIPLKFGYNDGTYNANIRGFYDATTAGSLAFDTGYSAPTEKMRITGAGNVGIGTTTPETSLSVVGTSTTQGLKISNLASSLLAVDASGNVVSTSTPNTSQWITNGTSVYYNAGSVGIGTTIPDYRFQVKSGDASNWIGSVWNTSTGAGFLSRISVTDETIALGAYNGTGYTFWNKGNGETYMSGNVGIGTTTPGTNLHVKGSGATTVRIESNASNLSSQLEFFKNTGVRYGIVGYGGATDMYLNNEVSGGNINIGTTGLGNILINNGKVGIGTTTPAAKLEVYGTAGNNAIANFASSSNASILYVSSSSKVGIGNTNPDSLLSINSLVDNVDIITLRFPSGTTGDKLGILFQGNDGTYNIKYAEILGGVENWSNDNGYIGFRTSRNTVLSEKMRLTASGTLEVGSGYTGQSGTLTNGLIVAGNAGFGTTTPATALSVVGTSTTQGLRISNLANTVLGVDASGNVIATTSALSSQWTTNASNIYYNTGNVGIGTTGPQAGLQITRNYVDSLNTSLRMAGDIPGISFDNITGTSRNFAILSQYGGAAQLNFNYSSAFGGNPTNVAMTIDGANGNVIMNNNVGIGAATPAAPLQTGSYFTNMGGGTGVLTGAATEWETTGFGGPGAFPSVVLSATTSSIKKGSLLGLDLHNDSRVLNSYSPMIAFSGRSNSGIYNSAYATILGQATGQGLNTNYIAGDLVFATAPVAGYLTERMRINNAGYVGIGTANPGAPLTVLTKNISGSLYSGLRLLDSEAASTYWDIGASNVVTNPDLRFSVNGGSPSVVFANTGNVGIGTTTPSGKLSITGSGTTTGKAFVVADLNNVEKFSVLDNGNLSFTGTVTGQDVTFMRAYRNGAQSVTGGTQAKINFNAENYDTLSEFDSTTNYRFTAINAGYYQVNAAVSFTVGAAGVDCGVSIMKNGSVVSSESASTVNIYSSGAAPSDVIYLAAGDYIEVGLYIGAGGTYQVTSGSSATYLSISRIRNTTFIGGPSSTGVPANSIVSFNQTSCPTGWVMANGTGGTPDLRGIFIRGAGTSTTYTNDAGSAYSATFGTEQDDAVQGHRHDNGAYSDGHNGYAATYARYGLTGRASSVMTPNVGWLSVSQQTYWTGGVETEAAYGTAQIANETRPASYALIYCMKTTEDSQTSNTIWGTTGSSTFVQDITQNIGIGTTGQADSKLIVKGIGTTNSTFSLNILNSANTTSFYLGDAGAGYLRAASWIYGSDERMKENISYVDNSLSTVLKLKPAKFDYLGGEKNQFGFIAQDVQKVVPDAVSVIDQNTGFLGIKTGNLIPFVVDAVQNQQKQISAAISKIKDGITYMRNIVVETFAVGSKTKPAGITMYDQTTGDPYCVQIINGSIANQSGACNIVVSKKKVKALDYTAVVLDSDALFDFDINSTSTATSTATTTEENVSTTTIIEIIASSSSVSTTTETVSTTTNGTLTSTATTTEEIATTTPVVEVATSTPSSEVSTTTATTTGEIATTTEPIIDAATTTEETAMTSEIVIETATTTEEVATTSDVVIETASTTDSVVIDEASSTEATSTDVLLTASVFGARISISQGKLLLIVLAVQALMILVFGFYSLDSRRRRRW